MVFLFIIFTILQSLKQSHLYNHCLSNLLFTPFHFLLLITSMRMTELQDEGCRDFLLFAFFWQLILVVNLIGSQGAQETDKNVLVCKSDWAFPETTVYEAATECVRLTWMWAALCNRLRPEGSRSRKGSQPRCASSFLLEQEFPLLWFTVDILLLILWPFNMDLHCWVSRGSLGLHPQTSSAFLLTLALWLLWLSIMQPPMTELSNLQLLKPI